MSKNNRTVKWISDDGYFILGRHAGVLVEIVVRFDYAYVSYIVNNFENMDEGDREILQQHLRYRR